MTEECKKEIDEFVIKNDLDYKNESIFCSPDSDNIDYGSISLSKRVKERRLDHEWVKDYKKYDRYFLEFIGHILRKYKIKEVTFAETKYKSDNWKFDNIKTK